MKSLIIILMGLGFTYRLTDMESENFFYNMICPLGVAIFLCGLVIWVVQKINSGHSGNASGDGGSGSGWFDGGGGDGGGDGG